MDMLSLSTGNWTQTLSLTTTYRIWSATPKGSPLRKFYIHYLINRIDRPGFAETVADYPTELMQELALAFMQRTKIVADRKDSVKDLQDAFHTNKCTL